MNLSARFFSRCFAACVLLVPGMSGVARAASSFNDLGEAFPHAVDRSANAL